MVIKFDFYGLTQEIDTIPEKYEEFIQLIENLFNMEDIDKLTLEYTFDKKKYYLINKDTYNAFFNDNQNAKVFMYAEYKESNYYKNENKADIKESKEEKEEIIEINKNNNLEDSGDIKIVKEEQKEEEENNNTNIEIKIPEITKEQVIASILKGVKERRQQSKIQLEKERKEREKKEKEKKKKEKEKKKKEEKKPKDFAGEISNLITNRVENFKKELINESKIKLNQAITESQMQLNNVNLENKDIKSLEQHPNISCSKCGMNPIVGNRYCCAICNNTNFCDNCEEEIGFQHGHPLYKFKLRVLE